MNRLQIDFDPIEVPGRASATVAATMARLSISVDGRNVTRVFDKSARTVRDWIITPLAPIAEWIALNWWTLLEEPSTPSRRGSGFRNRHLLRSAEEGFVLPNLQFISEGDAIRVDWEPRATQFAMIDFQSRGCSRLPKAEVETSLRDFLQRVVGRLEQTDTPAPVLLDAWDAVVETSAAEEVFCRLAGRLGLDPYNLGADDLAMQLMAVADELPPSLLEDFACAVDASQLAAAASWVLQGQQALKRHAGIVNTERCPLPTANGTNPTDRPWQRGYAVATAFREQQHVPQDQPLTMEAFLPDGTVIAAAAAPRGLDAVIGLPDATIYTAKSELQSHHFIKARALFATITKHNSSAMLLTSAYTTWQQQSRAFAAEVLAPAAYLKAALSTELVSHEEAAEIAQTLNVSPWVVEYQISNHRIAGIEQMTDGMEGAAA